MGAILAAVGEAVRILPGVQDVDHDPAPARSPDLMVQGREAVAPLSLEVPEQAAMVAAEVALDLGVQAKTPAAAMAKTRKRAGIRFLRDG